MPIEIGRKQSIEEITNGRIKKKAEEGATQERGRARAEAARKSGRTRR